MALIKDREAPETRVFGTVAYGREYGIRDAESQEPEPETEPAQHQHPQHPQQPQAVAAAAEPQQTQSEPEVEKRESCRWHSDEFMLRA